MTIDAWTFDVGTTEDHAEAVASRVEQSWDGGADVVLFPEYSWAAMPGAGGSPQPVRKTAQHFWANVLPALQGRLARPGKLAVLGTSPCFDPATNTLSNRSPILVNGRLLTQDKLFLTPWETSFTPGETLHLFEFLGLRVAVVICLDIEMPELSALLRGRGVDLILVPSATETILGSERVTRCASARSVELGCAVIVSPLVGRCDSVLVDENVGKLGGYLPSQAAFSQGARVQESAVFSEGFHVARFTLESNSLQLMRQAATETNPSLISSIARLPQIQQH